MGIRGLELLFNIEKKNFKSREDCLVAALHCLLINENLQCVGINDEWPETDSISTELLPENWNNQDVYSLRYSSKDRKRRILLKATRMDHIFQIDVVMNEDIVASLPIIVNKYISDDYSEYSSAYKDLESLSESFRKDIIEKLVPTKKNVSSKSSSPPKTSTTPSFPLSGRPHSSEKPRDPFLPGKPQSPPFPRTGDDDRYLFDPLRDPSRSPRYPRIGGSDLDPFSGPGAGGMLMDPSSFGIPSRPTLPQFGVGGPGGLPRGAVPPGARFDPFMPPIRRPRNPNPDHYPPPDFDDFDFM